MSSAKPRLAQLAHSLKELTWSKVKLMVLQLSDDYDTLRKIDENKKELSDKVLDAMDAWLKSDTRASWEKVVEALSDIDKNVLAEKLKTKFCQTPPALATTQASSSPTPSPAPSPPPTGERNL